VMSIGINQKMRLAGGGTRFVTLGAEPTYAF
jgi:hypothetical protein